MGTGGSLQAPVTLQRFTAPQPPGGPRSPQRSKQQSGSLGIHPVSRRPSDLPVENHSVGINSRGLAWTAGCAPTTEVYLGD